MIDNTTQASLALAFKGSAHETEKFVRQGCVQCQVEAYPNLMSDEHQNRVRLGSFQDLPDVICLSSQTSI